MYLRNSQAYYRLLVVGLVVTLTAGVGSMIVPNRDGKRSFGELVMAAQSQQEPQPVETLTRLPGKDGSAPVPVITAKPIITTALTQVAAAASVPGDIRLLGRSLNAIQFGDAEWPALESLWTRESNWNPGARNRSGACGIPQALPCNKILDMSSSGQITWGLSYIRGRYGTPTNAWLHSQAFGWY